MQEGHRWERATSVSESARKQMCAKLAIKFTTIRDDYSGLRIVGLGEPEEASCRAILAQGGGGKCWVSSVFLLLTGRKSGNIEFFLKLSQKRWQSAYIADKKKDGAALKRIRTSIGMHMKSEEFEKTSIECLGYAPNIWELDKMCKSNADISEPWVSETRARDALKCFRTFFFLFFFVVGCLF